MVQIHLLAPRGVEQLVARLAHNQEVAGSSPAHRNHIPPQGICIIKDAHSNLFLLEKI